MRYKTFLIGVGLVVVQLFIFRDYIFPFQFGQIKVTALACTCPHEKVINGRLYLFSITPDSLKKYNLDYSEIYVTEIPSTPLDPMGADIYMIKGEIVGKKRVYEGARWNPLVKVNSWREVNFMVDWIVKGFLFLQILVLSLLLFIYRR